MIDDTAQTNEFIAPTGRPVAYVPDDAEPETIHVAKMPTREVEPPPAPQTVPNMTDEQWEQKIAEARAMAEHANEKPVPTTDALQVPKEIPSERPTTTIEEPAPVRNIDMTVEMQKDHKPEDDVEHPDVNKDEQERQLEPAPGEEGEHDDGFGDFSETFEGAESEEALDDNPKPISYDEVKYDKDDDEDPVIDVPIGNMVDDITRLSAKFNPTGSTDVLRERVRQNPDDFYLKILQLFSRTGSTLDLIRASLEKEFTKGHVLHHGNPPNCEDSVTRSTVRPSKTGERVKLSGREAKLAVLARAKGLKKLHLFNSGFWVVIRPPRMAELSQWYNEVSMESKDFGRILAGHVYLFSDVLLKQKFMEFLPSIVVDSNLEGWKAPERLSRMISIHDYDVLVWGVCTLIYKEAITVNLHCTNEECQYVAHNYKVDLQKLRWNNFDIVPKAAVDILSNRLVSSEKVSGDDLRVYHKALGMRRDIVIGDTTYKVAPPSIYKFIQCGSQFIRDIVGAIKGDVQNFDAELDRSVRTNVVLTYLPWVNRVVTPDFETDDQEAIIASLEADLLTSPELADKMLEYQFGTKITHFCYTLLKCPRCGKTPSGVLKDYFPLEPSNLFFYLYSRQLSQTLD